jgi:photosystem II stability/assembly factor-like uncharacterized protein
LRKIKPPRRLAALLDPVPFSKEKKMSWIAQTSGSIVDLNGVSFVDARHGWAVGEGGLVLRTEDGGRTWSAQGSGTTEALLAVCFPSAAFGCAVGNSGTILTTTNGGQNWRVTQHVQQGNWHNLFDVHFVDPVHGWACGAHGTLIATADGGTTWQDLGCPIGQQVEAIDFVDASFGWAAGADGAICATRDGGLHWTAQASGSIQSITGIRFADRQRGFAVDLGGAVWITGDGGQHWESSHAPSSSRTLLALDLVGPRGCCAVGATGLLLVTDNNGATWRTDSAGSGAQLRAVDFVDAGHGWVVGTSGTIMCFEQRASVDVPSWTHEVAIDPVSLVLPNGIYVKWVEGRHPHTPEHLERFLRGLRPAELRVISTRAAELRDLSAQVERVASQAVGKSRDA